MNQDEIVKLTQAWYELVSIDHHKDRDCHWVIEVTYSYGKSPSYVVVHNGYVYDKPVNIPCSSLYAAEKTLIRVLRKALRNQREEAREVAEADWDWDDAKKVLAITDFLDSK